MDSNQTHCLVDLEPITQLKAGNHRCEGTQDRTGFPSLFLDDTVHGGGNYALEGPAPIVVSFSSGLAGSRTAQIAGLPEAEITLPDAAKGIWAFRDDIDRAGDTGPAGFFGYRQQHDEYVRTAGDGKIAKITITGTGIDPLAASLPNAFERMTA